MILKLSCGGHQKRLKRSVWWFIGLRLVLERTLFQLLNFFGRTSITSSLQVLSTLNDNADPDFFSRLTFIVSGQPAYRFGWLTGRPLKYSVIFVVSYANVHVVVWDGYAHLFSIQTINSFHILKNRFIIAIVNEFYHCSGFLFACVRQIFAWDLSQSVPQWTFILLFTGKGCTDLEPTPKMQTSKETHWITKGNLVTSRSDSGHQVIAKFFRVPDMKAVAKQK